MIFSLLDTDPYFLYGTIVFAVLLVIGIVWLIIKYNTAKLQLSLFYEQNIAHKTELELLHQEKIALIKNVEQLSTSLKHQEQAQADALNHSKAALYDLSHNITKQLLDLHKQETNESRKAAEENISKSTEAFNNELKRVQELLTQVNKDMADSKSTVDNLKQALLSPSSAGYLAEITLENILKNSGLQPQIDFILQYSFANEQNKLRPDALVFLPNDNLLIIDAKSSQFILNSEDENNLLKSMYSHLKALTTKDYISELAENFTKKNVKFARIITLMFIPTEQAIERLIKLDNNFLNKAWQQNIYPVGPAGLMNMLSIARLHITEKLRLENYEQILLEINNLVSSVATLSEHGLKLGNSIASVVNNYDKFAASFNRTLMSRVRSVQDLGVNSHAKKGSLLERYQVVSSKNDLIDAEPGEDKPLLALNKKVD